MLNTVIPLVLARLYRLSNSICHSVYFEWSPPTARQLEQEHLESRLMRRFGSHNKSSTASNTVLNKPRVILNAEIYIAF